MAVAALLCLASVAAPRAAQPAFGPKPAALALAAQLRAGRPVVFVEDMFYDVPFYAGLTEPVIVASDWDDPAIARATTGARSWPTRRVSTRRRRSACCTRWRGSPRCLAGPAATSGSSARRAHRGAALDAVPGLETLYADRELKLQRAPGRDCAR